MGTCVEPSKVSRQSAVTAPAPTVRADGSEQAVNLAVTANSELLLPTA